MECPICAIIDEEAKILIKKINDPNTNKFELQQLCNELSKLAKQGSPIARNAMLDIMADFALMISNLKKEEISLSNITIIHKS